MESKSTPNITNVPEFLQGHPTDQDKHNVKLAYAKYIRDQGKSPKQAACRDINLKELLVNLQELDVRWMNIPPSEIKTSPPRTLIQRLNIVLDRWR